MSGDRTHVFVNYATEDSIFVDWLCLRLLNEGYRVWCDRLKLLGGESYPKDIDDAISNRTARFVAVLSKDSIHKPNPLKERTLALQIARQRNESFVIPLNLQGLSPTDLGWMQSDLTFIPFTNWKEGLSQLLKNLERSNVPKEDSGISVSALLNQGTCCIKQQPETLWSNLIIVKSLPAAIYRFEHEIGMKEADARSANRTWSHYRENSSVCWSFEPPPVDLATRYKFSKQGTCADWRRATGPDINFYNLGKKVANAALRHSLMAAGLETDPSSGSLYFPDKPEYRRFIFRTTSGSSWIRPVGIRSFWTVRGSIPVRYHLSPYLTCWLDYGALDVVRVLIRLHITEIDGAAIRPSTMQSRRKAICKSWWNHQWLCRILATLQLIGGDSSEIRIGTFSDSQVTLDRFPLALEADRRLDESLLRPEREAHEEVELLDRHYEDSEVLLEEGGDEDASST